VILRRGLEMGPGTCSVAQRYSPDPRLSAARALVSSRRCQAASTALTFPRPVRSVLKLCSRWPWIRLAGRPGSRMPPRRVSLLGKVGIGPGADDAGRPLGLIAAGAKMVGPRVSGVGVRLAPRESALPDQSTSVRDLRPYLSRVMQLTIQSSVRDGSGGGNALEVASWARGGSGRGHCRGRSDLPRSNLRIH
jgi:hypothetical protein